MADAIFSDPRLAQIYDAFDPERNDLDAYLNIVREFGATSVLDVGCGTGCFPQLLACNGVSATGVDPAQASIDIAKTKANTTDVKWLCSTADALPALQVDMAVMTGNVAQVFLTDDEWKASLDGINAALKTGGYLVFETRRPERAIWKDWAVDAAELTLNVPGVGVVKQSRTLKSVELPFVSFRHTYAFDSDGAVLTSDSTLRFRSHSEIETSLLACGYSIVDVREAPDRPGHEFVFIAKKLPSLRPIQTWDATK